MRRAPHGGALRAGGAPASHNARLGFIRPTLDGRTPGAAGAGPPDRASGRATSPPHSLRRPRNPRGPRGYASTRFRGSRLPPRAPLRFHDRLRSLAAGGPGGGGGGGAPPRGAWARGVEHPPRLDPSNFHAVGKFLPCYVGPGLLFPHRGKIPAALRKTGRARGEVLPHRGRKSYVLREPGRARGEVFPHRGKNPAALRKTGRARGEVLPHRGRKSYVLRKTSRARGEVFPRRGTGRLGRRGGRAVGGGGSEGCSRRRRLVSPSRN